MVINLEWFVMNNPVGMVVNSIFKSKFMSQIFKAINKIFLKDIRSKQANFFMIAGLGFITWKLIKLGCSIWKMTHWIPAHLRNRKDVNQNYLKQRYGANCYALVTGCTEGIGLAYTLELAKMNIGVVLMARNREKLQKRINEIKAICPSFKYETIIGDLSKVEEIKRVCSQLTNISSRKNIDIGIVINNAGLASNNFCNYFEKQAKSLQEIMNINFLAPYEIDKVMIPILRARPQRSALLNIASCGGVFVSQGIGTYCFSKVMLDIYTRTMALENRDKIDILSVRPFGVKTPMMSMKKGKTMITPKDCAISSFADLGKSDTTWTGFKHKLQGSFFQTKTERQIFQMYDKIFAFAKK